MNRSRNIILAGLILLAFAAPACKLTETDGTLPGGPSTYVLTFTLTATPNVLMAGEARPTSVIQSVVTENGLPAAARTVYFTITGGVGEFADLTTRTAVVTDSLGVARIVFVGPTKYEIDADTVTTVMSQLETSSPQVVAKAVELTILVSE